MDGGYIEGTTYYFFITDHLGSNRVVANASGTAIQNTHYYPFGTAFAESTGQEKQPYKYNGKELDLTHGLNLYDYSARYMDSPIGRFTSVDPKAEKYYSISPYAYVANNPIKYIDLKGDSLTIMGKQSEDAMNQLQARAGNSMTLSMGDNGNISYSINNDKNGKPMKLKGDAKRLAAIIDHTSIKVNVATRESSKTSLGNFFIGGAFMGNAVVNGSVTANQEVNPSVFARADAITGKSGQLMMHEVTEAFEGAKITQKTGVGVGPATQADEYNVESVYSRAHNNATSQPILRQSISPNGIPQWTVNGKVFLVFPLR